MCHIVAIIGSIFTALAAAYFAGNYFAKVSDAAQLADVTAKNGQCQVELSGAKQQIATLTQANTQLTSAAKNEDIEIGALRQKLVDASAANAAQKNCDFVHDQIKAAEEEIDRLRSGDVFSGTNRPDADARVKALDEQIAGYQSQLGNCGNSVAVPGSER